MALAPPGPSSANSLYIASEEECVAEVYRLIDTEVTGAISQAALAQALLSSKLVEETAARTIAAEGSSSGQKIDPAAFHKALLQALDDKKRAEEAAGNSSVTHTLGGALIDICDDLRNFYVDEREDYRLASLVKYVRQQLHLREEMIRKSSIAVRQESEHQGVQEAQMMQAMEFNSAWSQNMTEFERQAREIEDGAIRRHQEEFDAFRQKMYSKEPHCYKFSRELLNLKQSVVANAKQKNYPQAHALQKQVDALERWERMKLDNEHKTNVAQKELQLRQQQQSQLEALKRRIQRGREEHKEHWLMGAQRLMQSHRNMLSDLKSKQALENLRSDVAVKLEMQASKAEVTRLEIAKGFPAVLPKVDSGAAKRGSRKALGVSQY